MYTSRANLCVTSRQYQNQPITTNRTSVCCSLTKIFDEQVITMDFFRRLFAAENSQLKYARHSQLAVHFGLKTGKINF